MLTGNKGEWSEPYVLLKLLADGNLSLGDENFNKIKGILYPIIKVIRHEKAGALEFEITGNLIVISRGSLIIKKPITDFVKNAKSCFDKISTAKKGEGAFSIMEIESFLNDLSINSLKAKSKLKNDITIQIEDPNTFITPTLGFSIKSQLGRPSTLVNASGATRFTYKLNGPKLSQGIFDKINGIKKYADKLRELNKHGVSLSFEKVENSIFNSNLQTIDSHFATVLSELVLNYYSNDTPSKNSVANFIKEVASNNILGYNLSINPLMYELMMKKFLTDYALGMRAAEVWQRNYQATGGYLIVRDDGELICYHFYFAKNFEDYLFNNTKLDTPDKRTNFGFIYEESGQQKIMLNLQIRFKK
jgi:type II restriction enzyme